MFLNDAQVRPAHPWVYPSLIVLYIIHGHFSSVKLPRYIDKLTNEMKEAGNLEGILLTGLTKDGVDLMESYVDRTGDVQTASFCMLKVSDTW